MRYRKLFSNLLIWLSIALYSQAAPTEHMITKFPGYNAGMPSQMYTGYIPVANGTMQYNYIFVEAFNNPDTAPIALWMQGGPGGSGMIGFFTEIGPFSLDQYSYTNYTNEEDSSMELFFNPYTWARNVNFIFFESPAPTGYSYCTDECPQYTDEMVAQYNYEFITNFFELYPEHKSKDFYITGESYAGIYVPTLANEIMQNENDIKLTGVIIGNCCMGAESTGGCSHYQKKYLIDFLYNHGQISTKIYNKYTSQCSSMNDSSETCEQYFKKAIEAAGYYDQYNYYNECPAFEEANSTPPDYYTTCYKDQALFDYMNQKETKKFFKTDKPWEMIVADRSFYTRSETETFPYYQMMMDRGIKSMVYFGDVDTNVPYNSGYNWVRNHFIKKFDWRPWTLPTPDMRPWYSIPNSLVAGYMETFEGNFTYVTVRGSGHMVPRDKPEQALQMFENFVFDIPFNTYKD